MIVRRLARPLLGSIFIVAGAEALQRPSHLVPAAQPVVDFTRSSLPSDIVEYLPQETQTFVRLNAAAQLLGGLALASGKFPRISSLILAGTIVPATVAGHAFWQESNPEVKAQQKIHFWKNVSILGGLLIAGFDTEGRPGLTWRTRKTVQEAASALSSALPSHTPPALSLSERVHGLAEISQDALENVGDRLEDITTTVGKQTSKARKAALKQAPILVDVAKKRGAEITEAATEQAQALSEIASRRVDDLVHTVSTRADKFADQASDQASELVKATAKNLEQWESAAKKHSPAVKKFARRLRK